MSTSEFQLIKRFFAQQTQQRDDVIIGIGDDSAILRPTSHQLLAVSIDTSIKGVHFTNDTPAHSIGHKTLAVSLSDMAAMGAEPLWVTLAITLPSADETWVADYCQGFFALADRYNVQLVGGDLTKGHLSITTQVHGSLPPKKILTRSGAKPGDLIFVTGIIGAAGLGLQIKQHSIELPEILQKKIPDYIYKLQYPEPRIDIGIALRGIATAAIDISDGLAADLGHILNASKVGAELTLENIPVIDDFERIRDQSNPWQQPLTAGDDYELIFTLAKDQHKKINAIAEKTHTPIRQIGTITEDTSLQYRYRGEIVPLTLKGFEHF